MDLFKIRSMPQKNNVKQLLFIIAIATAIAAVAYVAFFLYIRAKNKNISTLTNEVELIVQKEIRLRSIERLINDTKEERAALDTYFVGADAVVAFIETIEALGRETETAIEIASVSVDNIGESEEEIAELLRLSLKTEGTWQNFFHLLLLVEALPLNIVVTQTNINTVSLQQSEDEEIAEKRWEGTLSVVVVKRK